VALGVRPEDLHLASGDPAPRVSGVLVLTEVLGSKMLAHVEVAGEPVATEDVRRVSSMKAMSPMSRRCAR
jgi:hypothetical protein